MLLQSKVRRSFSEVEMNGRSLEVKKWLEQNHETSSFFRESRESIQKTSVDEHMMPQLVELYRDVYGNDPVWKEGAYLEKGGIIVDKISLAEYLKNPSRYAEYKECFPKERLIQEFSRILLTDTSGGVCVTIHDAENLKGFFTGEVGTIQACALPALSHSVCYGNTAQAEEISSLLGTSLHYIQDPTTIAWFEEIIISPQAQDRPGQFFDFIYTILDEMIALNAHSAVLWTHKKTLISYLCLKFGWYPCLFHNDIVFFEHPDIHELHLFLKKASNKDIRDIIMAR